MEGRAGSDDVQAPARGCVRPPFAFGLTLVAFRSIVVAIKAIVLNLLSVAAAYGVRVLVFQHGVGKGLLGFSSTADIAPVVPLLLFVILLRIDWRKRRFILN